MLLDMIYCTFKIVQFLLPVQELDIIELEKRYWYLKSGTKTGQFDIETFTPLVLSCVSESLAKGLLCYCTHFEAEW